jgi:hypothetical protein
MEAEELLGEFVEDYRFDSSATPLTIGIEVRDAHTPRWRVVVGEALGDSDKRSVALEPGFPTRPVPFFTTDMETLQSIYDGELAALTAMGKAFDTDFAPLNLDEMPGCELSGAEGNHLIKLSFHFWTRGFPEVIRFGSGEGTRFLHGADGTLFYYQKGFRSGFFQISPGQHVNSNKDSQTNPFPSLFILTKGRASARLGRVEVGAQ